MGRKNWQASAVGRCVLEKSDGTLKCHRLCKNPKHVLEYADQNFTNVNELQL